MSFRSSFALAFFSLITVASAQPPMGLDAITQFSRIPELRGGIRTGQTSSRDPDGGNDDHDNWLAIEPSGEKVMLDLKGPGCVYRIWFTGRNWNMAGQMRIYFDGSATPAVDMLMSDFFSGTQAPFLAPLVGDYTTSSGGYYCYVPMAFQSGCRITTTNAATLNYFNVTYQQFATSAGVTTFTPALDVSAAQSLWNAAGVDPKPAGPMVLSGTANVPAGGAVSLAAIPSAGVIQSVELNWPGLAALQVQHLQDSGRQFSGYSQFNMVISASNAGVKLVRRMYYRTPNQKADVYVDNVFAGTWYTPGSRDGVWRDAAFWIPTALTSGKSSIQVRVQFVSAEFDSWNEFYYSAYSLADAQWTLTDQLDVGDVGSEAAHSYVALHNAAPAPLITFTCHYQNTQTPEPYTDDGRSFSAGGRSEFTVNVEPAHTGVQLVRRYNTTIPNQKATVSVDAGGGNWQSAGLWTTPNATTNSFNEAIFSLPFALTSGKSSLHLRIQSTAGDPDWYEHYYRVLSVTNSGTVLSDELDVGRSDAEAFHGYTIVSASTAETNQLIPVTPTFDAVQAAFQALRIQAAWEAQATLAVDAPVGLFFGDGLGPAPVKALPLGVDGDRLYCYFPMPFGYRADLFLRNTGATAINGIGYTVRYTPLAQGPTGVGRFHTQYRTENPTTPGSDYTILSETGSGHLVGVTHALKGTRSGNGFLEGDERIYIDGSKTPALYGTGTEDFYNSGWYFYQGIYNRPVHGNALALSAPFNSDACYRFLLSDLIPFTSAIKVGMEHGPVNDEVVNYQSVAFYYRRSEPLSVLSDQLDVGTAGSETAHNYTAPGSSIVSLTNAAYEGDDPTLSSDAGRQFATAPQGYSQFNMTLSTPANDGLLLRRRMAYNTPAQTAAVYVDNQPAGTWYDAGQNTTLVWRESEFVVPASLTQGKTSIQLRIVNTSASSVWTEYYYWAYTLLPVSSLPALGTIDSDGDGVIDPSDNCPLVANAGQLDSDLDGVGDVCDACPGTLAGVSVDAQGCPALIPGDMDRDGDVDVTDFGLFQACFSGSAVAQPSTACARAKIDADTDVDVADYLLLEKCLSGKDVPASPTCTQ